MKSPAPIKNFPLLWKTFDYIAEHPEEWDQNSWAIRVHAPNVCHTAFCFAGHAVVIANPSAVMMFGEGGDYVDDEYNFASLVEIDGEGIWIGEAAARDLGLTPLEADKLFDSENTLDQVHGMITQWELEA